MTLRELIEEHPDWMDYDMVVYDDLNACLDYIGASGNVQISVGDDSDKPVILFSGNLNLEPRANR